MSINGQGFKLRCHYLEENENYDLGQLAETILLSFRSMYTRINKYVKVEE